MGTVFIAVKREIFDSCTDYVLTPAGTVFCAVSGLLAELFVLFAVGVRLEYVPVPVFGFLWILFGILGSGMLISLENAERVFEIWKHTRQSAVQYIGSDAAAGSADIYDMYDAMRSGYLDRHISELKAEDISEGMIPSSVVISMRTRTAHTGMKKAS